MTQPINPGMNRPAGTRIITPRHRVADKFAKDFIPDEGFDRFEAIHILKRAGSKLPRSKGKPRWRRQLIDHLELLVSMTQERDWHEGQPIVWMSVGETADRLGISPSQIHYNEKDLFELGALIWTDSANHKRFGRRGDGGRIIQAFGVNLAPLGQLTRFLKQMDTDIAGQRRDWRDAKQLFSSIRRKIRGVFAGREMWPEAITEEEQHFNDVLATMRVTRGTKTEEIKAWTGQLCTFLERLDVLMTVPIDGPIDEPVDRPVDKPAENRQNDQNIKTTDGIDSTHGSNECHAHIIQDLNSSKKYNTGSDTDAPTRAERKRYDDDFGSSSSPPLKTPPLSRPRNCQEGVSSQGDHHEAHDHERIDERGERIRDALDLGRFLNCLPLSLQAKLGDYPDWRIFIEHAFRLGKELGIHQSAWNEACDVLGSEGAALIIVIIAVKHERCMIRSPGGYLRGMVRKAKEGLLDLMPTIYGIQSLDS